MIKKMILLALILGCYFSFTHTAQRRDIDPRRAIRVSRRNNRQSEHEQVCPDEGPCPYVGDPRPKGNVDYNPWEFRDAFKEYYVRYPYHGYFNYGSSFARIKRY